MKRLPEYASMQPHAPGFTRASPEFEVLLCCCSPRHHSETGDRTRSLLSGDINFAELLAGAIEHKIVLLLFEHLSRTCEDLLPEEWRAVLASQARQLTQHNLGLAAELVRTSELFQTAGIPVIPYKGPLLSILAYGDLARRASADLDFAVEQSHVPDAVQLLLDSGYRANFEVSEAAVKPGDFAPGQYSFSSCSSELLLELHTERTLRYFPRPLDFRAMRQRLQPVEVGRRSLSTFCDEDLMLMLCVHGAKHFWDRLLWICDIAQLTTRRSPDWDRALECAGRVGARRMLLLGALLAHNLLGASIPPHIVERAERDGNTRWLASQVAEQFRRIASPETGVLRRARFRFSSADSARDGIRHLSRLAFHPTESDRETAHLAAGSPLYRVLRPWRLLRAYGLGLARRPKPDLTIYLPMASELVEQLLEFAKVGPGDVLYDLGCGDGRIVVAAARQEGVRAVGVDVDARRIAESCALARRARVGRRAEFVLGDARSVNLQDATVVTLYLGADGNLRMADQIRSQLRPGSRVVSCRFPIHGWPPDEQSVCTMRNGQAVPLYLWRIH